MPPEWDWPAGAASLAPPGQTKCHSLPFSVVKPGTGKHNIHQKAFLMYFTYYVVYMKVKDHFRYRSCLMFFLIVV